jgi:hypothetical protein
MGDDTSDDSVRVELEASEYGTVTVEAPADTDPEEVLDDAHERMAELMDHEQQLAIEFLYAQLDAQKKLIDKQTEAGRGGQYR